MTHNPQLHARFRIRGWERQESSRDGRLPQRPTGYLMAFGAMVALARRTEEGGSWLVRISLAQVGRWLVERGQVPEAQLKNVEKEFTPEELERWTMVSKTPVRRLRHLAPVVTALRDAAALGQTHRAARPPQSGVAGL